jgi:hypothetical protein
VRTPRGTGPTIPAGWSTVCPSPLWLQALPHVSSMFSSPGFPGIAACDDRGPAWKVGYGLGAVTSSAPAAVLLGHASPEIPFRSRRVRASRKWSLPCFQAMAPSARLLGCCTNRTRLVREPFLSPDRAREAQDLMHETFLRFACLVETKAKEVRKEEAYLGIVARKLPSRRAAGHAKKHFLRWRTTPVRPHCSRPSVPTNPSLSGRVKSLL